jgi:hypothetical protein
MSAGFFGVFQVALFIKRSGFNVRLVLYDEFAFEEAQMRAKLVGYPGLESLLDEVECEYIGDRKRPLRVSPRDNAVATVWYSAYLAQKLCTLTRSGPFLYLIQDYETVFFPASSSYALADESYGFDFNALFSTEALQRFFLQNGIGRFAAGAPPHAFFNNACSSELLPWSDFSAKRPPGTPRRLAFYSRPVVHRNMFELGALCLCEAYAEGVFNDGDWEFFGIGLGSAVIELADGITLRQLPRMNLRDYQGLISSFDVGLCLMASSHPSLLPFDLAGSGAVVVTNTFGVKDQAYFDQLAPGVIAANPDLASLVGALRRAARESGDLERRYRNAQAMLFPRSWEQTFGPEHVNLIRETFRMTGRRS